jgi:hypothetical protein
LKFLLRRQDGRFFVRSQQLRQKEKRLFLPASYGFYGDPMTSDTRFWHFPGGKLFELMLDEFSYSPAVFREASQKFYWLWKTTRVDWREYGTECFPLWGHAVNRMYIPNYLHYHQIFLIPFKQLWVFFNEIGWLKYYPFG